MNIFLIPYTPGRHLVMGYVLAGASLVVWAIRDGRDAAASIHKYLAERVDADSELAIAS